MFLKYLNIIETMQKYVELVEEERLKLLAGDIGKYISLTAIDKNLGGIEVLEKSVNSAFSIFQH